MTNTEHYRRLETMYLAAPINREVYSGVEIAVRDSSAEICHEVDPAFFHGGGALHGSVYFKLLDDAAFFAASSVVTDEFILTVSFQIQIVRPITRGILKAVGTIEKPGKRVLAASATLFDERNRKVAFGQGQFMKSGKLLAETEGYII